MDAIVPIIKEKIIFEEDLGIVHLRICELEHIKIAYRVFLYAKKVSLD